jgi:hypothetical protein
MVSLFHEGAPVFQGNFTPYSAIAQQIRKATSTLRSDAEKQ